MVHVLRHSSHDKLLLHCEDTGLLALNLKEQLLFTILSFSVVENGREKKGPTESHHPWRQWVSNLWAEGGKFVY